MGSVINSLKAFVFSEWLVSSIQSLDAFQNAQHVSHSFVKSQAPQNDRIPLEITFSKGPNNSRLVSPHTGTEPS